MQQDLAGRYHETLGRLVSAWPDAFHGTDLDPDATLKRMEKLIRPRWRTPFETTKRTVGFVVLLLAATLVWPFPFSHIIPALVIMLISFAYLEEDGALLCISLGAALVSLGITSATVWATIRATDLLEQLFGAT